MFPRNDKVVEPTVENQRDLNTPQIEVASYDIPFIRAALCDSTSPEISDFANQGGNPFEQNFNYHQQHQEDVEVYPLYIAASQGYSKMVQLLLEKGAKVNVKNSNGDTPLYIAALKGRRKITKTLLKKRANVDAKNYEGKTPFDIAELNDHVDDVDVFNEARGAVVNVESCQNLSSDQTSVAASSDHNELYGEGAVALPSYFDQMNMGASESVGQADNRPDSGLSDANVHGSGTSRQNY